MSMKKLDQCLEGSLDRKRPAQDGAVADWMDLLQAREVARRSQKATGLIRSVLPMGLHPYVRVVINPENIAVVFAGNSAVASRLRADQNTLLGALKKGGVEVTAIRIRVQASTPPPTAPRIQHGILGEEALASFAELAAQVENPALKERILRMIERRISGKNGLQHP